MTRAPILALPDHSQTFIVEADTSGHGIGVVLMQNQKPIAFMSNALGPRAVAFSTYDKEALAIIKALKKWKHYLVGSTLVIRTDQQSLKYIQEQELTEGIQHKLLIKLLGYNYKVEYKRGRRKRAADALSRCVVKENLGVISAAVLVWIKEVIHSYEQDDSSQELIVKLSVDPNAKQHYTLNGGILRYKNIIVIGANTGLRAQLIMSCHDSSLGGHLGERVTCKRMELLFH